MSAGIDMEAQQHEILSNFDTFLKIAGSELGSLRSVARYYYNQMELFLRILRTPFLLIIFMLLCLYITPRIIKFV